MWSLETIKQINAKHAELGRNGKPVNARTVYTECGISTLGSAQPRGLPEKKEDESSGLPKQ